MRNRRLLAASAATAGLALALSACSQPDTGNNGGGDSSSNSGGGGQAGGAINVGWNQPFYSYNEFTSNGNATANANIKYMMNSNFWYYDPELNLKKDTSFGTYEKTSDDPLTVKYTVADGVNWSDGTPVDAADMLLVWASQSGNLNTVSGDKVELDPDTNVPITKGQVYFDTSSPGLALVTKTPEISDDGKSLTLVYDKPFADWELDMSVNLPAHVTDTQALGTKDPQAAKDELVKAVQDEDTAKLSKIADFWNSGYDYTSLPDDPSLYLSDGSYLLTEMVENQYAVLEKNPDYKGMFEGNLDRITVRWNEDPMAQVQALQNGEIDLFSPQVTTDVLDAAKQVPNTKVDTGDEGTYEHVDLTFNNGGPFDPKTYGGDEEKAKLVRQAFLHAYPRQEMVDKLIKPISPQAETRDSFLLTPGAEGYDEMAQQNGSQDYAQADPALAKKLLQQAGVKTPVDVRMMYAADNVRRSQEYQLAAPAVKQAGFNLIDKQNADWGSKLGDGTYDAVFFGWQSTSTGVSSDQGIYASNQINNLNGYSNKQVDALFDQLVLTTDPQEQLDLQIQIEKLLYDDAYGITLFQFPGASFWNETRMTNVDPAVLAPTMFYGYWDWSAPSAS